MSAFYCSKHMNFTDNKEKNIFAAMGLNILKGLYHFFFFQNIHIKVHLPKKKKKKSRYCCNEDLLYKANTPGSIT